MLIGTVGIELVENFVRAHGSLAANMLNSARHRSCLQFGVTAWRLMGTIASMIPTLVAARYLACLVRGKM